MKIITVINAKGGCGKSTIAMNLAAGGRSTKDEVQRAKDEGTLVEAMTGKKTLTALIQPTRIGNLCFIASAERLEDIGRQITEFDGTTSILASLLSAADAPDLDFVVIDSPNQISPIMENAVLTADLFVVPFESTEEVRSTRSEGQRTKDEG